MNQISSQSDESCRLTPPPLEASCNYFFFEASRVKTLELFSCQIERRLFPLVEELLFWLVKMFACIVSLQWCGWHVSVRSTIWLKMLKMYLENVELIEGAPRQKSRKNLVSIRLKLFAVVIKARIMTYLSVTNLLLFAANKSKCGVIKTKAPYQIMKPWQKTHSKRTGLYLLLLFLYLVIAVQCNFSLIFIMCDNLSHFSCYIQARVCKLPVDERWRQINPPYKQCGLVEMWRW